MRIQIETLYTLDAADRLVRVNEPNGKPAPRFFLGRTVEGKVWRFRNDLEPEVVAELEAACMEETDGNEFLDSPYGATRYHEVLARSAPITKTWAGPAYTFPDTLADTPDAIRITEANVERLATPLAPWSEDVAMGRLLIGVMHEGEIVSVCGSVRTTSTAHEAGVETAAPLRGRGFAVQPVRAWARAVREMNCIPIYSTSWDNLSSRALAEKLGLIRFGTDLHIT
ncbi:MAG TPA: GNAT family N-acetyltransferase [Gemmatimonadaceae bacterium]|nr:GNAT family N-acetyltransferase [Gemmatimonadaceae bacterium]